MSRKLNKMQTWQKLKQNPKLFDRYFVKEYMIQAIREFFEKRGYHEFESPILASALPQERYLDVLDVKLGLAKGRRKTVYIVPTTETYNKKMLAAGLGEHFVITKVCRGLEDIGPNHSPEFTMLEWYHLDANYFDLMDDCEELLSYIKQYIDKKLKRSWSKKAEYQGTSIDLSGKWPRLSVPELLKKYVDLDLEEIQDKVNFRSKLKAKGYKVSKDDDWQTMFEWVFAQEIEPNLPQDKPVFVYDYPKQVCPLTKLNDVNPFVCEKVELYIAGKEMGNGYTELRDWKEQEKRFKLEQEARKKLGKKEIKFDHELIKALKSGLPPVAGIGLGLDRLAMIFADAKNISEVNYFPATEFFD